MNKSASVKKCIHIIKICLFLLHLTGIDPQIVKLLSRTNGDEVN